MKFAFASLVCLAAALLPAAQASLDITISAEKFNRRRNPEFGRLIANDYLIRGGKNLPKAGDVAELYQNCKWKSYGGIQGWLDENNVQCYLSPSYKYHAHSSALPFDPVPSIKQGACIDTKATFEFPDHIPKYTISVPYLYFNNLYDRRCKVRALVKVPGTESWVLAWVIEHNGGNWDASGQVIEGGAQHGILVDQNLWDQAFNKEKTTDPKGSTKPHLFEWFFADINTLS
ncbi:uncharacterized protein MEPE_01756 [Melanopsichium pennsylvanicum]|uniref:Uncharacterized protein n=2 Tax=Melanopsichium pennsylvanicum TaxID=63383 RepID=A0AAJ4XJ02_9BASI|nr:hypothetical protein BN887_04620 [Melanopsichium pennsylvanicum 4]SNX83050.1 uncharacterized protein MEPE_01756 [Melanopsichium pennsylvanicum]